MKVIKELDLNLLSLPATASSRQFSVTGDDGAVFSLEVKNEDKKYYNFVTRVFQVAKAGLYDEVIYNNSFEQTIFFPTVTDDDQYDIFLFAQPVTTSHADYNEVRFGDGSIDINSSTGSNSLLITKVIYQYLDQTLTLLPISVTTAIETGSQVSDTVTVSSGASTDLQAFSIACSVTTAAKCYQIIKQPVSDDVIAFVQPVVGAAPITIAGENIYPNATAAFTGDDINGAVTSGLIVDTDATDISANIKSGDKITTPVTTDTVNGAVSSGIKVVMDNNVATKMAVGDQVTGNAFLDANLVTVAALDPDGDNAKEFSLSEAVAISDGITLTFSSKINRSLTTVTVFPTDASAFAISQAIQFRDNAPLTFFNQRNYQWPITNFANIVKKNMVLIPNPPNIPTGTIVSEYKDTTTEFEGTKKQKVIIKKAVPAVNTLAIKPVVTNGKISTQAGSVVLNNQLFLEITGTTLKIGGYGKAEILRVYGYEVEFSNLAIALTPITTTTTSAVDNSTSVPVTSRNGILDDVSTVSGIGINPALVDPTVDTGAGAVSGAGTLVLTAAQTLEDGATLTFANASLTATISGKIEVTSAGGANQTLRFDIDKLLSIT